MFVPKYDVFHCVNISLSCIFKSGRNPACPLYEPRFLLALGRHSEWANFVRGVQLQVRHSRAEGLTLELDGGPRATENSRFRK